MISENEKSFVLLNCVLGANADKHGLIIRKRKAIHVVVH